LRGCCKELAAAKKVQTQHHLPEEQMALREKSFRRFEQSFEMGAKGKSVKMIPRRF
jgi:hypothetical protein